MTEIDLNEQTEVEGGTDYADAACGILVGATIAATVFFGPLGGALLVNKAAFACILAVTT